MCVCVCVCVCEVFNRSFNQGLELPVGLSATGSTISAFAKASTDPCSSLVCRKKAESRTLPGLPKASDTLAGERSFAREIMREKPAT